MPLIDTVDSDTVEVNNSGRFFFLRAEYFGSPAVVKWKITEITMLCKITLFESLQPDPVAKISSSYTVKWEAIAEKSTKSVNAVWDSESQHPSPDEVIAINGTDYRIYWNVTPTPKGAVASGGTVTLKMKVEAGLGLQMAPAIQLPTATMKQNLNYKEK